ncbi:ArnT family glycosyltransferase [Antrihabitans sp. NCIMB 15449]|uniref:ArnT family glycosyltransferase n=1 Tax=Antrihabitans spumae TaxID=3373370 RepID=A0ABW7JJZ2_9NOCA
MTITAEPPARTAQVHPTTDLMSRLPRLVRGPADQPGWARPALLALLAATAALYLWGLSASGWANEFYAAAVQAGTQDWKALLFGSLDAGNAITVDKPPAAMWVMGLSGRLFGFSSFSMLAPQALLGVGSVALVYASVKRWSGPGAGLLAGAALAATPVAALMFRFNNPDALLVFLLVLAAYCTVRATENGSGRWLALAGSAVGFAFMTKMMQAFLVVPALGLVFLVAAPITFWRRIGSLLTACAAMIVSGGWFVALVSLWPSDSRPYIGGSTDNSLLELALGYNGLGRVVGGSGNMSGGGGGGAGFGGGTGISRLFGDSMGTEISWLLPAALIGLVAGLWFTRRAPRTDKIRASLLLWGSWLVVTGLVFSYMQGIFHPYYTVALAPAIAALVGVAVRELWRGRNYLPARLALGAMLAGTGIWSFILLDRTPDWFPAMRWVIVVATIVIASILVVGAHQLGKFTVAVAIAGLLFGIGGTAAYAIETAAQPHTGSVPSSGPNAGGGMGGPGGMTPPSGMEAPSGMGTPGGATTDSAELEALLEETDTRWAAATIGAMSASSLELSTGTAIIAIGGFSGSDNSPTLEQFKAYVADHNISYFVADNGGMGGGPGGGSGASAEIKAWVEANFTATTVGGSTVYDLTGA